VISVTWFQRANPVGRHKQEYQYLDYRLLTEPSINRLASLSDIIEMDPKHASSEAAAHDLMKRGR